MLPIYLRNAVKPAKYEEMVVRAIFIEYTHE
jgi:hypothetical protein